MAYRIRPGITMVKICDTNLLVAARQEWEHCPVVRPISRITAAVWKLMEEGQTDTEVIHTFAGMLKKTDEEMQAIFSKKMQRLIDDGFLIPAGEDVI